MDFKYFLANPSGNITILAKSPVDSQRIPEIGSALLKYESSAEQVGFLTPGFGGTDICLRMAGDEFCGNATLSAGAAFLMMTGRSSGSAAVSVYGVAKPLCVTLEGSGCGVYSGSAEMPLPGEIKRLFLSFEGRTYDLTLVSLGGISHLVTYERFDKAVAEAAVKLWCRDLNVPALGLMQLSDDEVLTPLVYVDALNSLYWEHSCASGTCACAHKLAAEHGGSGFFTFREPGGTLSCEVGEASLKLFGNVILEEKTISI